jgi:hypothetical protein
MCVCCIVPQYIHSNVAVFRNRFSAIYQEYTPREARRTFYVHMTNVTETSAMRGILSSGKCAFGCTEACSEMSISMRLHIQDQSANPPSSIKISHMLHIYVISISLVDMPNGQTSSLHYRRLSVVRHLQSNIFGPIMWKRTLLCCKSIPSL